MNPIRRLVPSTGLCGLLALLAGCASHNNFNRADTNQDGFICFEDFDAYMKDEVFTRVDANGDGKLSRAEAAAFREIVRQQPGTTPVEKLQQATRR